MSEASFYQSFVVGWFVLSALVFVALLFISAPYGRHTRAGWGPRINGTAGWVIMELPAVIGLVVFFALGNTDPGSVAIALVVMWEIH